MSNPNGAKGASFERLVADGLAKALADDRIDRRVKTGAKDRGDIANLRVGELRVVVECKHVGAISLGAWLAEAEVERQNDGAAIGVVIHKRRGKGQFGDQFVTMTADTFVSLLELVEP